MRKRRLPLLSFATLLVAANAVALPSDPAVLTGSLAVERAGHAMTVHQLTAQAAAEFTSFDVGIGERLSVLQPSSSSLFLARVTGGLPTRLDGHVQANGSLVVANPHGVLIGPAGVIEAGSFVAVALDADVSRLSLGEVSFSDGAAGAQVVNAGRITVADAGLAALVGPRVVNSGLIAARLGRVQLSGGSRATLDLAGDGFLQLALGDGGSVEQSGIVRAEGGRVLISADAAAGALAGVVNVDGLVEASSLIAQGGRITLAAGGGTVRVGGELAATSGAARGGDIDLSGGVVIMAKSKADVSGEAGGGRFVAKASDALTAEGDFSARAGALGGDGGFVELSGRNAADVAGARVDTRAVVGRSGTFLLDPLTVTIDATLAASIVSNLATTDYVVQADNSITVSSAINYSGTRAATLTLDAGTGAVHAGTITVGASIASSVAALNLTVNGVTTFNTAPTLRGGLVQALGAADVTLNAGSWSSAQFTGLARLTLGAATFTTSGDASLDHLGLTSGSSTLNGTGTLTLASLDWTSGSMAGAGVTRVEGAGSFLVRTRPTAANPPTLQRQLDVAPGATLTVRDTAGYSTGSNFVFATGAVLNNAGTVELLGFLGQSWQQFVGGSTAAVGVFNNLATGIVRAGSGTSTLARPALRNLAAFNNQGGTLTVGAATAALEIDNASLAVSGAGTGHARVSLVGGTAAFIDGSSLTAITLSGGTTTVTGAVSIGQLGMDQAAATLTGSGTLTLSSLTWNAGTMSGAGITELAGAGSFFIQTKDANASPPRLERRLDVLAGASLRLEDTAGYANGSHWVLAAGAVINNAGDIRMLGRVGQSYQQFIGATSGVAGTVNNLSTGVITVGSVTSANVRGVIRNLTAFNNQGGTLTVGAATASLDIDNANLSLSGAGIGHANVSLVGGTATLQPGASISVITLAGGAFSVPGASSIGLLRMSHFGAILNGAGVLTLGGLDWSGGTMTGLGRTELAGSGSFLVQTKGSGANPPVLDRRMDVLADARLVLRDTGGYSAGSYFAFTAGATLNNYGVFEMLGYNQQSWYQYVGGVSNVNGTFNNLPGATIISGGTNTPYAQSYFRNLTAMNIQGGAVTVGQPTSTVEFGNTSTTVSGSVQLSPGVLLHTVRVTGQVTAAGGAGAVAIEHRTGTVTFSDGASVSNLKVVGGTVYVGDAASAPFAQNVSAGVFTFDAPNGQVTGPGVLHITERLDWLRGELAGTGCTSLDNTGLTNSITTWYPDNSAPTLNREFVVPEGATLNIQRHSSVNNDTIYFRPSAILRVEGTLAFVDVVSPKYFTLLPGNSTGIAYGGVIQAFGGTIVGRGTVNVDNQVKLDARNATLITDAGATLAFTGAQAHSVSGITSIDQGVAFRSSGSNTLGGRFNAADGVTSVAWSQATGTVTVAPEGLVVDSVIFNTGANILGGDLWVTRSLDWRGGVLAGTGRLMLMPGASSLVTTQHTTSQMVLNRELVIAPGAAMDIQVNGLGVDYYALHLDQNARLRVEGDVRLLRSSNTLRDYMEFRAGNPLNLGRQGGKLIVAGGTVTAVGEIASTKVRLVSDVALEVLDGVLRTDALSSMKFGGVQNFSISGFNQFDPGVSMESTGTMTITGRALSADGPGTQGLTHYSRTLTIGAAGLEVDSMGLAGGTVTGGDLNVTSGFNWTKGTLTTATGGRMLLSTGSSATVTTYTNNVDAPTLNRTLVVSSGAAMAIEARDNFNYFFYQGAAGILRVEGSLSFRPGASGSYILVEAGAAGLAGPGGRLELFGGTVEGADGVNANYNPQLISRNAVMRTGATGSVRFAGSVAHEVSGITQLDSGIRFESSLSNTISGSVTSADGTGNFALRHDSGTLTIGSSGLVVTALHQTGGTITGAGDIWVSEQFRVDSNTDLAGPGRLYLLPGQVGVSSTNNPRKISRITVNEAGSAFTFGAGASYGPSLAAQFVNRGLVTLSSQTNAGFITNVSSAGSVVNEGELRMTGNLNFSLGVPLFNAASGTLVRTAGSTGTTNASQGWLNQNTAYPATTGVVATGFSVSGTNPASFPVAAASVSAPTVQPATFTSLVFTPAVQVAANPVTRIVAVPTVSRAAFDPDSHSWLFTPSVLTISTAPDSEAWTGGLFRLDSGSGTININTLLAALASGSPLTISSKGSIVFDTDLSYLGVSAGSLQLAVDAAAGNRQGFIQLPASLTSATAPLTLGFNSPVAVKSTGSTIATSGGAISFASPLGGGAALDLSAGVGSVSFSQAATLGGFTSYAAATSGPITGLTAAAANTTFSGAQNLSGALSVTGGLTLGGGLTAAGAVTVTGQLAATGSASISTANGAISLNAVTGPGSLALTSGTAAIQVAGDITSLGALSLQTAGATGNVTLSGTFDVGALNVLGGGQAVLLGGAQGLSSATSATFAAGVPVTLGDQSGDRFSFLGALNAPNAVGVTGVVTAGSAQLGDLTLSGSVNTTGDLSTGTLTLADDSVLGTGSGSLSTGAIAGATHALTLSSATGNVTVSGGVSQVGALTLQAAGSTGVATVSGVVDLGTLTVAGGTASLLGGNNGTSAVAGVVTVAGDGTLSLGDQTGDTFGIAGSINGGELRLAGGATASAASASLGDLRLGGILQLGGVLNASAVTLTGDSLLQASGNITLASVVGAGHDLTVSAASANLVVSGDVTGVDVLTLLPLTSVTVNGALAANTAFLDDDITVGSAAIGATHLSGDFSGTGGNVSLGAVTLGADSSVLTAGGDLSLGSVTGNGYRLILDGSAGDVTLGGGISGLTMLQIQSPASSGDVTIAGAVSLSDLLVQGTGSLSFLGGNAGVTTLTGNISLAQTGGLRFGDQAGDQFSLNPISGDLNYAGAVTLGGALSLPAGQMQVGSLSLAADASIVASGQVNLGSVAVVANGHDLTVTAGGQLASAGVIGVGDLSLSGALGQSLSGSYLAGGTIQLGAADTVLSGDVVLRAAEADFTGRLLPAAGPNAGSLAFEPAPATADMVIGGTASTAAFDLTAAEMALIGNGFTSLRFGSSAGSGTLTVDAPLAFSAPVSFVSPSGSLVLSSALTTAGQSLSIDAALRISGTASIDTTSGGIYPGGSLSVGSIQGAVAGPSHLTLDTGSASLSLGAVGNLTPLDSLTLASDGLTTVGQDITVRDLLRFEGPVSFGAPAIRLTADTIEAGLAASFVGASTELTLASASGLPVRVGGAADSGAGVFDVTSGLLAELADLGAVRIIGGTAPITVDQPVTIGVPLVLATSGLTDLSSAVALSGDGALTVTGDLRLSGSVTGSGSGAIRVLGDLDVAANASFVTTGVIQVGTAGTSVSGPGVLTLGGADVDFLASTGALTLGGLIVNAGDLTLGSSSADIVRLGAGGLVVNPGTTDLRLGQLYSAGDVSVGQLFVPGVVSLDLSGADFHSTAVDIAPPGSLTIRTSGGDAALGSLSASSGGGSLLVDAGQGSVSLASASMSGPAIGTVDITAAAGTLGPLRVAGDIDVTSTASAGAGPMVAGLSSVGGDVRLAGQNLSLSGTVDTPGLITVSADLTVPGTSGALRAADVILTGSVTPATASSVLTIAPYVSSAPITLGGVGTGGFHLSTTDLAAIGNGFATVIIGGVGQSGDIDVLSPLAPQATLSLQTTGMTNVPHAVVTAGGAGFGVTGDSSVSADITTAGGAIALLGATTVLTDVTFDTTAGGAASTGGDVSLGNLTLVTTSPTANTFTIKAGANGDIAAGDILLQNSTSGDVQLKILSGRDVTVGELPDGLSIDSQATGIANGLPSTGADPQLSAAARVLRIPTRLIDGVASSYQGVRAAINDQVTKSTQEGVRLSSGVVPVMTVAPAAPSSASRIPVVQGVVSWVGEGAKSEGGDGGLGSLKLVDNLSVSVQGGNGVINYEGTSFDVGEGTVVRKAAP